jgi:pyruvate dehydrogenase E2 component (dihydrolipoamide acetyltransferase)
MRRAIAATVSRSKREIPHFYLASTVDLGPALAWLAEENVARPVEARVLPGALLLWASAHAVRAVPELNAWWEGDHAEARREVHLGVVLSLRGGGLVAPAISDAHTMDLDAIMAALGDISQRARSGGLRSSEMTGATLSVTSLGERGAPTVFPVIFPPQVAMVGFGRIVERPWVVGGAVVARSVVDVTLAVDHRVLDGHRASLYLEELADLVAHPEKSLTTETTR